MTVTDLQFVSLIPKSRDTNHQRFSHLLLSYLLPSVYRHTPQTYAAQAASVPRSPDHANLSPRTPFLFDTDKTVKC